VLVGGIAGGEGVLCVCACTWRGRGGLSCGAGPSQRPLLLGLHPAFTSWLSPGAACYGCGTFQERTGARGTPYFKQ
jgi:hypothetical protein